MVEQESNDGAHGPRLLTIIVVAVLLVGVAAAVFVVVRNASRVKPATPEIEVNLGDEDPKLEVYRRVVSRRLATLDHKLARYRSKIGQPTVEQESLLVACDTGFVHVRGLLADIDSMLVRGKPADVKRTVNLAYRELSRTVTKFVRTLTTEVVPEGDSLDAELEELIGD